ncbi:MAG: sugar transferase, partial [Actinobacteria bacterium]|nr:sugar transferase [Actinomycetota bacterium]
AGRFTPLGRMIAICVAGLLVVWSRAAVETWFETSGRGAVGHRSLLVTGSVASARRVVEVLHARPELGTTVTGLVAPERPEPTLPVPWVGTLDDLPVLLRLTAATGVSVVGSTLDPPQLAAVLRAVQSLDVRADLITLDDADSPQFRVLPLSSRSAVGIEPALSATQRIGKRAFDLVAGAALAVVALPVVLTAAALLKVATGGPVFVQDVEQGPRAEPVTLRRLRTRHLPDTRLARWVGTVCRRLCIDELPQLGNVLAGSMTLVGPRPRPTGHTVTPVDMSAGLIGLRHVEWSDLPALRAHRRTDEFYIENWSVGLDLSIIAASASEVAWRTVREMVVRGEQRETVAA